MREEGPRPMAGKKRKHKRYPVDGLHGNMLLASDVNIINLSLGGAAIEAEKRLNIGREYTLKLEGGKEPLALKGVVVWSVISRSRQTAKGDSVPVYTAGLQFKEIFDEKARSLMDFLDSKRTPGEGRLSGLRFLIESKQPAVLNYPFNYRVKNISADGMEIETDQDFNPREVFMMELFLDEMVPVSLSGRVASCREIAGDANAYQVDIKFLSMSDEHRVMLEEFVKSL